MTKTIERTNRFKKEYKLMKARGKDISKLTFVLNLLLEESPLPIKCRDHKLSGNYEGWRELHIEPDWLLIYKVSKTEIWLDRTGTHSDLFDK